LIIMHKVYSVMISNFVTASSALFFARRVLGATIDTGSVILTVLVSVLSLAAAYVVSRPLAFSDVLTMVAEAVVFVGAYLTLLPLIRAVVRSDIVRLVAVLRDMGLVWVVTEPIMKYELWLTEIRGP
jgi:hypothetical protein